MSDVRTFDGRPGRPVLMPDDEKAARYARWFRRVTWFVVVWASLIGLVRPGLWLPRDEATLTPPMVLMERYAYTAGVPAAMAVPHQPVAVRSDLRLFEDERPLGPASAPVWTVISVGTGAFYHDGRDLMFSTSDNADPNQNGRRYTISYPRPVPPALVAVPYAAATVLLMFVGGGVWRRVVGVWAGHHRRTDQARTAEAVLLLLGLTLAVFAYPQVEIFGGSEGNTISHLRFAEKIVETGVVYPAHFLFQAFVIAAHTLIPRADWLVAGLAAVYALYALLGVILWLLIRRALDGAAARRDAYFPPLLAVSLLVVAPITMGTWHLDNVYFGYIVSHQLWSQSMIALKPFAVLGLVLSAAVFRPVLPDRRPRIILALAASVALATVAKPSFTVCLLPALGLMLAPRILRGQYRDLGVYVVALAVPNVLLLIWQYVTTYMAIQGISGVGTEQTGIIFAPFFVMGHYTELIHPGVWWLLPKFLLSVLFPLAVTVLYWARARQDWRFGLAWLMFGVGCASTYLVAEVKGPFNGNFVWAGQITLFLLFVAAVLFVVEHVVRPTLDRAHPWWALVADRRAVACAVIFGLHVVAGVYHTVHPLYR